MDNVEPGDDIPWFPDWRLLGRHALAHLRVGQELDGMVVEQNLYWGAVVDVNAEYHGLVYIAEVDWYPLRDIVDLGVPVRCRVSRINDPERFRFPLELELVDPDISDALTQGPPERRPLLFYADETPEQWVRAVNTLWAPPPPYGRRPHLALALHRRISPSQRGFPLALAGSGSGARGARASAAAAARGALRRGALALAEGSPPSSPCSRGTAATRSRDHTF